MKECANLDERTIHLTLVPQKENPRRCYSCRHKVSMATLLILTLVSDTSLPGSFLFFGVEGGKGRCFKLTES